MDKKVTIKQRIIKILAGVVILILCAAAAYKLWRVYDGAVNYVYVLYDDHAEFLGYVGKATTIVVPDKVKGKPVTVVKKRSFYKNNDIKKVILGRNVKEIETEAFYNCEGLKSVTGKAELEIVGEDAFWCCYFLGKLQVGNHIKRIEAGAFSACVRLDAIGAQPELEYIGHWAFNGAGRLLDFQLPEHFRLEDSVFNDSRWLYNQKDEFVIVGECLLAYKGRVREGEFGGWQSADEVVEIPDGVVRIAKDAFGDCPQVADIEEVWLPPTVTDVAAYVFEPCQDVKIYMPSSVTEIGGWSTGFRNRYTSEWVDINATIVTTKGSYAEKYAKENDIDCEIVEQWWQ